MPKLRSARARVRTVRANTCMFARQRLPSLLRHFNLTHHLIYVHIRLPVISSQIRLLSVDQLPTSYCRRDSRSIKCWVLMRSQFFNDLWSLFSMTVSTALFVCWIFFDELHWYDCRTIDMAAPISVRPFIRVFQSIVNFNSQTRLFMWGFPLNFSHGAPIMAWLNLICEPQFQTTPALLRLRPLRPDIVHVNRITRNRLLTGPVQIPGSLARCQHNLTFCRCTSCKLHFRFPAHTLSLPPVVIDLSAYNSH